MYIAMLKSHEYEWNVQRLVKGSVQLLFDSRYAQIECVW